MPHVTSPPLQWRPGATAAERTEAESTARLNRRLLGRIERRLARIARLKKALVKIAQAQAKRRRSGRSRPRSERR